MLCTIGIRGCCCGVLIIYLKGVLKRRKSLAELLFAGVGIKRSRNNDVTVLTGWPKRGVPLHTSSKLGRVDLFRRYDEVCNYDFSDHSSHGVTGHFTQVVWKDSTQLGIGKYTGQDGPWTCTYIVARYKSAGNYRSQFEDNVSKGSFSSSQYCDTVGDKSLGENEFRDIPEGSIGSGSTGD